MANRHLLFLFVSSWSLPVCATNSVKFGWISPKMPVYGWKCCFLGLLSEKPCFGLKDDTLQPLKVGLPGNHRAGCAQCATSWTPSPFLSKLLCNLLPFAATQPPCFLVDLLCCFAKHIDRVGFPLHQRHRFKPRGWGKSSLVHLLYKECFVHRKL